MNKVSMAVILLAAVVLASGAPDRADAETTVKKRIILCLDGTWNNPAKESDRADVDEKVFKPTNVLKTCRAVLTRDPEGVPQLSYYDIGVGALRAYPGGWNRVHRTVDNVFGGARGAGFEGNVEDAYTLLVNNYDIGDEVFIFGFSRGAAEARSLTRFIDWMGGIVRKSEAYWIPRFFDAYLLGDEKITFESTWNALYNIRLEIRKKKDPDGQDHERKAKAILGKFGDTLKMIKPIIITYLGVWDTVLAIGKDKVKLHIGDHPASVVAHARHAIGIDEKRYEFLPKIWKTTANDRQVLEQKWFAGVHSNIGGGYVDDGLANQTLDWVLDGAREQGLALDEKFLRLYNPYPYDQLYNSSKPHWVAWEFVTFRHGKGVRNMSPESMDLDGTKANLSIDRSVFGRMVANPCETRANGKLKHENLILYRPNNLLDYLGSISEGDLDQFLIKQMPDAGDSDLRSRVKGMIGEYMAGELEMERKCG